MGKYFFYIFIFIVRIYSQAELTSQYIDYFKINENSGRIKSNKISKITTVISSNFYSDTVNTGYYNKEGLLIKEISKFIIRTENGTRSDNHTYYFIYDEYNYLITKLDSTNGEFKKTVLSYDDDRTISDEDLYDDKGKTIKIISNDYDNLSRLVESTEKDVAGNCKITNNYSYDSYSNIVKYKRSSTCKDSNYKAINITYKYRYDNNSRIIEKNTLYSDKEFKTESFSYGSNGLLDKSYVIVGQEVYTMLVYAYDKLNNLAKIERTEVNGNDKTKFMKYFKYDLSGNVLEVKETNEAGDELSLIKYLYEFY